jgi:hypothetical protein
LRKNAPEGSLPSLTPSRATKAASTYDRAAKQTWKYVHNPSSNDLALKTKQTSKAFGQASDYQGNIKMQKFSLYEKKRGLHPDAKFVKINKNNVDDERDLLTNIKLWWAKTFKKQEGQPAHLKDKGLKPRYDKGEQGLWYD